MLETAWPKITVVVPSFNQARYIEKTLLSIIEQNYPNLELIVMDGGSTDGSVEIIKRYEQFISYWVSEQDGGQTAALINGFDKASGDIYCWLNSDDVFMPGTLHEVAGFFKENLSVDAVFGNAVWMNENDQQVKIQREIPFNRFIWMNTYNYIPGMSMFWRREIYHKVGGLNPSFNLAMDADLWIRFDDVGEIAHVSRIWSGMRLYPEQKNQRFRKESDTEDFILRQRYRKFQSPVFLTVFKCLAYAIRILWKLITGCYGPHNLRFERKLS